MSDEPGGIGRAHVDGQRLRLTLPACNWAVRDALEALRAHPAIASGGEEFAARTETVLGEVLNNIVEHAYPQGTGQIAVTARRCRDVVLFRVEDQGRALPDHRLPAHALPASVPGDSNGAGAAEELPEGGFGWFLIRELSKSLRYQRVDGSNRLCILLDRKQFI